VPAPLSDNGHLFDQYLGIALIHVAFQLGFCTFVLSNYMKTISRELNEAALVDGASVWTTYSKVITPLTKPSSRGVSPAASAISLSRSGVYFVRLQAGDVRQSKLVTLTR